MVYPLSNQGAGYRLRDPEIRHTLWEDVLTALREGREPTPTELMEEISSRQASFRTLRT